jgi:hypothetical protein
MGREIQATAGLLAQGAISFMVIVNHPENFSLSAIPRKFHFS